MATSACIKMAEIVKQKLSKIYKSELEQFNDQYIVHVFVTKTAEGTIV